MEHSVSFHLVSSTTFPIWSKPTPLGTTLPLGNWTLLHQLKIRKMPCRHGHRPIESSNSSTEILSSLVTLGYVKMIAEANYDSSHSESSTLAFEVATQDPRFWHLTSAPFPFHPYKEYLFLLFLILCLLYHTLKEQSDLYHWCRPINHCMNLYRSNNLVS